MKRSFFLLPVFLFLLLSLPEGASNRLRSRTVALLSPFWKLGDAARKPLVPVAPVSSQEVNSLQLENHQLRSQLDLVYEWLSSEKRLRDQIDVFRELKGEPKEFIERRTKEMKALLQKQAMAAFGRIIYRDPNSWSSSCWIDVGEEDNEALGQPIVAKNSPVVAGASLVGIVEYVGKRHSRVRLITDSGLKIAVRAVRGSIQEREMASLVHVLLDRLQRYSQGKEQVAVDGLAQLEKKFPVRWSDSYLAKGEVFGSSATYFRSLKSTLKGVGFNCDVSDAEGPARDLRSGILKKGDFLLTSGLDGVFPPGLKVGVVSSVKPLREGAFAYELEAVPSAENLSDLTSIYVLPPLSLE
ncbi:MAG: hypothetical protein KGJ02_00145 [Verrucomicrobiota bacterium]|nr:hypothetical protein [Verrucomicrobiota bacterium]